MAVLERSELQASPLADLHAIADQLGIDGYRRLRKPELIEAILTKGEPKQDGGGQPAVVAGEPSDEQAEKAQAGPRRRRAARSTGTRSRRSAATDDADAPAEAAARGEQAEPAERRRERAGELAEGVVELLGNGSAFLRVSPPEPSGKDVYISAAQVRRCELVSGDRVSGPVRTPRRSERYPSLVRIDTINSGLRNRRYPSMPSWSAIACRSARGLAWSSERSSTAIVLSPSGRMGGVHPPALDSGGHPCCDQP